MPRRGREKVYKTRRRYPGKRFSTKLTLGQENGNGKYNKKGKKGKKGRILLRRKMSYEEIYKVGDHNPFIKKLREEFSEIQGNKVGG